jgi:putative DNA primase/helicase
VSVVNECEGSTESRPTNESPTSDSQSSPFSEPSIHSSTHPTIANGNTNPGLQESINSQSTNPSIHKSSNPVALLNDLRDVIKRYVVLPGLAAETLALWVVHTYAFTLRQVTTYIGVVSPEKRCGKTTLLELLGLLASRSLTAANISPSALFRVIQETKPTLLIDEADTFLQGRDEIAGILNASYRKGNAYVVRVAEGKARRKEDRARQPEFGEWTHAPANGSPGAIEFAQYSCWCPKVMAAIGRLPDTLADRCIVITMQRKMPGEKCERLRHLNATEYRQRCAHFVQEHSEAIAQARPEIPSTLNDRAADIWEPLLAIADLAGGEWPELARQAAQKLSAYDDELTLVGYFLKDLRNYMVLKNVDRILSRDIVAAFNPMHHRPWEDLRRGREINEWWLSWKMRELGIHSRSIRVGEAVFRGYVLEDVEAAFRRYVPNPEAHSAKPAELRTQASDV